MVCVKIRHVARLLVVCLVILDHLRDDLFDGAAHHVVSDSADRGVGVGVHGDDDS